MSANAGFQPADYEYLYKILCTAIEDGNDKALRALLSNNLNIILAALKISVTASEAVDALDNLLADIPGDSNDTQWMSDELRRSIERGQEIILKADGIA